MRSASVRADRRLQRPLGADREKVVSWLAVDQKFAGLGNRRIISDLRSRAGHFFINGEQQSDLVNSVTAQMLGGCDLGGDDSFCIARATTVDEFVILT